MKTSNLQQGKTNSSISKDANVQKKSQKQQSPVRYGTWSRLPIS